MTGRISPEHRAYSLPKNEQGALREYTDRDAGGDHN